MQTDKKKATFLLIGVIVIGIFGYLFITSLSESPQYGDTELADLVNKGTLDACGEGSTEVIRLSCVQRYMAKSRDFNVQYCKGINDTRPRAVYEFQGGSGYRTDSEGVVSSETINTTAENVCVLNVARQMLLPQVCEALDEESLRNMCVEMISRYKNPLDKIRQ